jgi:outer membrane receptor protein involved in Fe transport
VDESADGTANFSGIEQLHQGIEIEGFVRLADNLKLNGQMSIGNWRYKDDVTANVYDDNQQLIGTGTLYLKDVKVGDAAQFTTYLGANYEPFNNFDLSLRWRNSSNLYADFSPLDDVFLEPNNEGAIKLPNYNLFDLGIGYKFKFDKSNLSAYLNINNLFNEEYIAESNSNVHATSSSTLYNGIDDTNYVWFGFGTTWNFSLRYNF